QALELRAVAQLAGAHQSFQLEAVAGLGASTGPRVWPDATGQPSVLGIGNGVFRFLRGNVRPARGRELLLGSRLVGVFARKRVAVLDAVPTVNLDHGIPVEVFLRSEEHTSELQSRENLVCRLLLEK